MNPEQFAKQILFNTAIIGLSSQQWVKSENTESHYCMYRHDDGIKRCAAGWLIPDRLYQPNMEKSGAYSIQREFKLFYWSLIDFISEMQRVHDNAQGSMRGYFKKFGVENGLEIPAWL